MTMFSKTEAEKWVSDTYDDITAIASLCDPIFFTKAEEVTFEDQLKVLKAFVQHLKKHPSATATLSNLEVYPSLKKKPSDVDLAGWLEENIQAVTLPKNYWLTATLLFLYALGIALQILVSFYIQVPWVTEVINWIKSHSVSAWIFARLSPVLMFAHGMALQWVFTGLITYSRAFSSWLDNIARKWAQPSYMPALTGGLLGILMLGVAAAIIWKISIPMLALGAIGLVIRALYRMHELATIAEKEAIARPRTDHDERIRSAAPEVKPSERSVSSPSIIVSSLPDLSTMSQDKEHIKTILKNVDAQIMSNSFGI